jgi:hypothetical protein
MSISDHVIKKLIFFTLASSAATPPRHNSPSVATSFRAIVIEQ